MEGNNKPNMTDEDRITRFKHLITEIDGMMSEMERRIQTLKSHYADNFDFAMAIPALIAEIIYWQCRSKVLFDEYKDLPYKE